MEGQWVMVATRQDEVERKYDVGEAVIFPDLAEASGVTRVGQPARHELEAVYFDTASLDLARRGVTLRRRTGGQDAGWHLKVPGGKDTRTETRLPLEPEGDGVPEELVAPVRAVVRDRPLVPVARISTRRLEYPLLGDDEVVLARVTDDDVRAERLAGAGPAEHWREWEVELDGGDRSLFDEVEGVLERSGASPAATSSKLARALGDVSAAPTDRRSAAAVEPGEAAHLLLTLLSEQRDELLRQDAGVRAAKPEGVHKLRIAARRMRSALTTYGKVVEPADANALREELRWLGEALAEARDSQVLREHLDSVLASEEPELVLGPVVRRVDDALQAAHTAGLGEARQALDSERYFRLLDALDGFVADPPLTPKAHTAARKLVPRLLARDLQKLRTAVRDVERADDSRARDLALHEARKKAKRLRYAAESAIPTFGSRAKRYAAKVKKIQQALGVHQDTVVARQALREIGVQAHLSGENGFTFGRLHALEQWRADQSEQEFRAAWDALPSKKIRRWIKG
jgi:CHAD domain-containing protein